MNATEQQALITDFITRNRRVESLDKNEFLALLEGLKFMFNARVWNCVDTSGKWDQEWFAMSELCDKAYKELSKENRQ